MLDVLFERRLLWFVLHNFILIFVLADSVPFVQSITCMYTYDMDNPPAGFLESANKTCQKYMFSPTTHNSLICAIDVVKCLRTRIRVRGK
jgi:hypothetical protein